MCLNGNERRDIIKELNFFYPLLLHLHELFFCNSLYCQDFLLIQNLLFLLQSLRQLEHSWLQGLYEYTIKLWGKQMELKSEKILFNFKYRNTNTPC